MPPMIEHTLLLDTYSQTLTGVLTFAQESLAPAGAEGAAAGGLGGGGAGGVGTGAPQGGNPMGIILPLMLVFFVFMIFTSIMGQRKEKKKRQALLSSLSKHDKIQTVGGMIGTIAEIRDDEVVIKVDDQNNVKIRFNRSAIQTVLHSHGGGGGHTSASNNDTTAEVVTTGNRSGSASAR